MNIPAIILIALHAMTLGVMLAKHGKPREDKHSAWDTLIGIAILQTILWWGGWYG